MKKLTYFLSVFGFVFLAHNLFAQEIQRVRIDLETPLGHTRQLLLGFTPDNSATDGFDYGYDAANIDNFPDDFSWMIDGQPYIIQGVGAFDTSKKYPIGFFLTNSGDISISLNSLENFDEQISVYIYDSSEDEYVQINNQNFQKNVESGNYLDNYYITFEDLNAPQNLSITNHDDIADLLDISYQKDNQILKIKATNSIEIDEVSCYNLLQQELFNSISNNKEFFNIRLENKENIYFLKIKTNYGLVVRKITF